MKSSIAIVDDNNFLIQSLKEKLASFEKLSLLFTARQGLECIELLSSKGLVDIILMDINMPLCDGIEATALIKKKHPQIKIIMLTVFDDDERIFQAIQAGADGYLLKDIRAQELYTAIEQTLEGGAAMTPSIARKALLLLRQAPLAPRQAEEKPEKELSARETEVLEQLATGLPHSAIAKNLFIAPATVRRHIENIYKKLQVHSKVEALNLAKKKRLI